MATRISQIFDISGFPSGVQNVPPNYPDHPSPDKLSLLFKYNKSNLWHRFSPYTDGDNIFGIFPNKQPFVYRYPDEAQSSLFNRLPAAAKTLAAAGNITQGTVDDVVRTSKFLVSPQGILYNIKQFGLQRGQPFDETRVYNPLSPILATISGMTFGIGERPVRHIEGGFISGLLNSITATIGINLQSGFQTPASTAGNDALPVYNSGQGKGLIRGATATKGFASLNTVWGQSSSPKLGLSGLISSLKDAASTIFGNPKQPGGTIVRADEKTYELMISNKGRQNTYTIFGVELPVTQSWVAKTKVYGTTRGVTSEGGATNSGMEVQYKDYVDNKGKYPTTFGDPASVRAKSLNDELQKVVGKINLVNTYIAAKSPASYLLPAGSSYGGTQYIEYDNWTTKGQSGKVGASTDYAGNTLGRPKTVDASVSPNNNLRIGASFKSDALNQVGVIGKDRKFEASQQYPNYTEYKPYEDDLIAFFFYDVVNNKYIPFRATVKGISEGNTAFWDELRFIGRSDQLYSYNGFSRTLSFTYNIVIGSITEMLPTWQKINYMASCVKPSNYTQGENVNNTFNRFIVPPMFMLTIGDMYKFQPIVITSINVNVPDDATWETLNEVNSKEWSYLNGIISSPNIGKKYSQLPREVEIAVTCNLLEKERAIVGGSHFGHSPRKDDWENFSGDDVFNVGSKDYLPAVTSFSSGSTTFNRPQSTSNKV